MVDSGVDPNQADLAGRVSSRSTDIIVGRNQPFATDLHGTLVAGVTAAGFNGFGTIGVAYGSTILGIRADISDCDEPEDDVCFADGDLARSIDYAVANGARVINMSLGGEGPLGGAFEAALARAVNAGVVFAIAAGNESGASPEWPGRYASDPRFAGAIIVVGAHNAAEQLAGFSNRAGVSASSYISAPGVNIISGCDGTSCYQVNGTSFSAPAVAGALALLLDAFPNLSGVEAMEILLRTARDAGTPGTDTDFGRGLLDIARAFQPVGSTSASTADGGVVSVQSQPGAFIGGAFGDALARGGGLETVAHDEYRRLFRLDLARLYPAAPRRSWQPSTPVAMQASRLNLAGPDGTRLSLSAAVPAPEPEPILSRLTPFDAPWLGGETRREALLNIDAGRMTFAAWQGKGGARSPFRTGSGDGFAALAQVDRAVRGGVRLGAFNLSAESGVGDRTAMLRPVQEDAARYARAALDWRGQDGGFSLSLGSLNERMGPLGAWMPTGSDLALPSQTRFAAFGGDWRLSPRLTLTGEAGFGRTELAGRFLTLDQAAISSSWRLGLVSDCPSWALGCRSLGLELSQPLRIEQGTFSALLADIPAEYFDTLTFTRRSFDAAPSGREIDLTLRSVHDLADGSTLRIEAAALTQQQHRRSAAPGYALLAAWRRIF